MSVGEIHFQEISDFLLKVDSLAEQINDLPLATAVDLYEELEVVARAACASISRIDPELRVKNRILIPTCNLLIATQY